MNSSELKNYMTKFTIIFTPILMITLILFLVYYILVLVCPNQQLAFTITLVIYIFVLTIYFTIFPFTKFPTSNKQTEEEN